MGSRGASSGGGHYRNGSYRILVRDSTKEIKGRIRTIDGVDFGISNEHTASYTITELKSGMIVSGLNLFETLREAKTFLDENGKKIAKLLTKDNPEMYRAGQQRFQKALQNTPKR